MTVNTIAECLRTDCNSLGGYNKKKFNAVHASNTKHEPTQNLPNNFHGKILYPPGVRRFSENLPQKSPQNSKRRKGDVKQVPRAESTNIRRHRTQFRRTDDMAPSFCARLS